MRFQNSYNTHTRHKHTPNTVTHFTTSLYLSAGLQSMNLEHENKDGQWHPRSCCVGDSVIQRALLRKQSICPLHPETDSTAQTSITVLFCEKDHPLSTYTRNWGRGDGVIQNVYRCVQGEGVSSPKCTYPLTLSLFYDFDSMFVLRCLVLFVEI